MSKLYSLTWFEIMKVNCMFDDAIQSLSSLSLSTDLLPNRGTKHVYSIGVFNFAGEMEVLTIYMV